jgi:hypothetical protein
MAEGIPTGPVTLTVLAQAGKLLLVYCRECGREHDLDPLSLPLPAETCAVCWEEDGRFGVR